MKPQAIFFLVACLALLPVPSKAQSTPQLAYSLDLLHSEIHTLSSQFDRDLQALLNVAEYVRDTKTAGGEYPAARVTSLNQIIADLHKYAGTALVVLARRQDAGQSAFAIEHVFLLPGTMQPEDQDSPDSQHNPRATPATRSAFALQLSHPDVAPLLDELRNNLQDALTVVAQQGDENGPAQLDTVDEAIDRLAQYPGVGYIVTAEETADSTLELQQVLVIPDIVRLTIRSTPRPVAPEPAQPEVEQETVQEVNGGTIRTIPGETPNDAPTFEIEIDPSLIPGN